MLTIKEIAELAGVSRGTVDRVVNGRGGVARAAEERVLAIVKQYGYKPNRAAKALAKHKKTCLLGVISSSIDNMFFKDVVSGIQAAEGEFRDFGVSLSYREIAKFSVEDQARSIDAMLEEGIDALAINPINDPLIIKKLELVNERGIPIMTFNSDIEGIEKLSYIGCDYHKSGKIGAGLIGLACQGNATVCIVTGSMKSLGHSRRVLGFQEALREFPGIRVESIVEMFDDEITSYCKVAEALKRNPSLNAFFFAAGGKDGGIRAIRESECGKNIRIVTVDIDPLTIELLKSNVVSATICQQPFIQGYETIKQLANYILFGEEPKSAVQYTKTDILIPQSV